MTTFEMGLLLGTVSGVVIGLCIAVILVKLETRHDRRPGYVTDHARRHGVTTLNTGKRSL